MDDFLALGLLAFSLIATSFFGLGVHPESVFGYSQCEITAKAFPAGVSATELSKSESGCKKLYSFKVDTIYQGESLTFPWESNSNNVLIEYSGSNTSQKQSYAGKLALANTSTKNTKKSSFNFPNSEILNAINKYVAEPDSIELRFVFFDKTINQNSYSIKKETLTSYRYIFGYKPNQARQTTPNSNNCSNYKSNLEVLVDGLTTQRSESVCYKGVSNQVNWLGDYYSDGILDFNWKYSQNQFPNESLVIEAKFFESKTDVNSLDKIVKSEFKSLGSLILKSTDAKSSSGRINSNSWIKNPNTPRLENSSIVLISFRTTNNSERAYYYAFKYYQGGVEIKTPIDDLAFLGKGIYSISGVPDLGNCLGINLNFDGTESEDPRLLSGATSIPFGKVISIGGKTFKAGSKLINVGGKVFRQLEKVEDVASDINKGIKVTKGVINTLDTMIIKIVSRQSQLLNQLLK